jgi:predicted RNA-binding protein with RPS1 domain
MSLGTTHVARVTGIKDYGVFFELIGVNCPGLMWREAITHDKSLDLEALFRIGQELTVRIKTIDDINGRVSLDFPGGRLWLQPPRS